MTPSTLYAGTAGYGIFKSVNGGADWQPFNDGLTNMDVRALAISRGTPKFLLAGTAGGVFKVLGDTPTPSIGAKE